MSPNKHCTLQLWVSGCDCGDPELLHGAETQPHTRVTPGSQPLSSPQVGSLREDPSRESAVSVWVDKILSDASLQQNLQYTQKDALFPLLLNETFIHFQRKLLVRVVRGLSDTVGTNCSCRWEQVVSAICYSFP